MRQYEREDIDYNTWYSDWMKMLAKNKTRKELEELLGKYTSEAKRASKSHLAAVEKSGSNLGNSSRRASTWNAVALTYDYRIAVSGALEIYDLFPEHTLEGNE